jgi:hypothetical protein
MTATFGAGIHKGFACELVKINVARRCNHAGPCDRAFAMWSCVCIAFAMSPCICNGTIFKGISCKSQETGNRATSTSLHEAQK